MPEDKWEFHEASEENFAALALELKRPVLEDDSKSTRAWAELRTTQRAVLQTAQLAVGEVVLAVRKMRADGKRRFALPAERASESQGIPLPTECYSREDFESLSTAVCESFRTSGLSEYVYSSVSRKLLLGELSKSKLRGLLNGETSFPNVRNVGIMMRSRNWRLHVAERVAGNKVYLDLEVEISALRPGLGKMRLQCYSLHGGHLEKVTPILRALGNMEMKETTGSGISTGWGKGALTVRPIRRPGRPEKWQVLLPYCTPRASTGQGDTIMVVHRSVVHMLTAATRDCDGNVKVYYYPGLSVVAMKDQMYARRRAISRDLAAHPHGGRGNRHHYRALRKLADAESRTTQTELWRAARWVQTIAEKSGSTTVYLDDFGGFDPDQPGPPFLPYVRHFPLADLKTKVLDALQRRAGVAVYTGKARYVSQRCPACGHVAPENVALLPVVLGRSTKEGQFRCLGCKFKGELDEVAARNMLGDVPFVEKPPAEVVNT